VVDPGLFRFKVTVMAFVKVKVGVGEVVADPGSYWFKGTVVAFVKVKVGVRFAADPGSFRFNVRLKVVAIMDLGYRGLQSYLPAFGHFRFSIFRSCIFNWLFTSG